VAGYASHTRKRLPARIITGEDGNWIERVIAAPIADAHLIAVLYMSFTLDSAAQYWRSRGGSWKGCAQAT
jgi:hypothetical protein